MLHWIIVSYVERFRIPLYSLCREVQTLTREDRDINGWLHFLRCIIFHRAVNRSCARHVLGIERMENNVQTPSTKQISKNLKIIIVVVVIMAVGAITGVLLLVDRLSTTKNRMTNDDEMYSYYLVSKRGLYGAESISGKTLVPIKFDSVILIDDNQDYFYCTSGIYKAAYSKTGECIISIKEEYTDIYGVSDCFLVEKEENGHSCLGVCSNTGKAIIPCKYISIDKYSMEPYLMALYSNGTYDIYYIDGTLIVSDYNSTSDIIKTTEIDNKAYLLFYSTKNSGSMSLYCGNKKLFRRQLSNYPNHYSAEFEADSDVCIRLNGRDSHWYFDKYGKRLILREQLEEAVEEAVEEALDDVSQSIIS